MPPTLPPQSTPFPSMSLSTPPTSSPLRPETQLLPTTATTPTLPLPAEPQSTTTHRHSLPPIPTQTRSLTLTDLRSRFPAATSAATSKTYSPLPNLQESLIWVAQNARLLAEREGMREEAERVKKELEVAMSGRKEAEEEMGRLTARLKEREAECEDLKRQMEEARALVERIEGDKVTIEREIDDLRARIVEEEARCEAAAAGYRADQESWARMNADLHEQLVVMTGKRDRTLRELERIKGTAGMEAERVAEVKGRNTSDEVERLNAEGGEDADADVDTASRAKHTARLSTDPHHPSLPLRASSNRRHSEPIQWPSHVRLHRLLSHNHDPQYHQHASLFPFTLPTFSVSNPNRTSTDTATSPASLDTVLVRRALAEREAAVAEAEKAREERDAWREAAKGLEKRVVEVDDMVRELRRRVGEAEVDPWGVVGQEGLMDEAGGFEGVTDELIS
ncbi:hypothetical protein BC938DRAFT_483347 [Jimgerdemannia flammicorona]|uniref:Uncharacterized protein n=1 Tax=Jimgerdemannia flammicorona TaxID=994334 RepID=A0A433QC31_9FUNG|nr:hypothetical protein BC938DRAFT_483347 [Jimgerdemannia flammicorona]